MRQLGNAVPVMLAQVVASSVHEHLALANVRAATARASLRREATA
jgi:DNA (cytosine-5)-methyltransferase 1